jgi:hypothetical protein
VLRQHHRLTGQSVHARLVSSGMLHQSFIQSIDLMAIVLTIFAKQVFIVTLVNTIMNGKQAKLNITNIHAYLLYIRRKLRVQLVFDTAKFLTQLVTL